VLPFALYRRAFRAEQSDFPINPLVSKVQGAAQDVVPELPSMSTRAPLWLLVFLQAVISAASLVVEIVAGRMIAPYVGMSVYSWTAIIAVVLAGFSAGHWWGGRIAARPAGRALAVTGWTMAGAALTTGLAALLLRQVAGPVIEAVEDPLGAITLITLAVFFLPSLFAGVPAPVLAVVAMRGTDRSEQALGAMFAAGAIGAIAGTLLAGFVFISWLGSALTLTVVTVTYVASAALFFLLAAREGEARPPMGTLAVLLAIAGSGLFLTPACDRESQYFCIRTVTLDDTPGDNVHLMVIDHLAHGISGEAEPRLMFTEHAAMLDALPRMRMAGSDFTSFHIGGGSYSVPRAWVDRGIRGITVSEIDPEVTKVAAREFWFDPGTIRILHEDARLALSRSADRYDVIVGDAFTDIAVPAHLVTREFFALVRDRLAPDGVFAMNLIDDSGRLETLAALVATLRTSFETVEVWTEERPPVPGERRVFVLLAAAEESPAFTLDVRAPDPMRFAALGPAFVEGLAARPGTLVLSDDYAPIDRLVGLGRIVD
jgi:predicted membrane-bound spermidine synthase